MPMLKSNSLRRFMRPFAAMWVLRVILVPAGVDSRVKFSSIDSMQCPHQCSVEAIRKIK
jgi:hypothetical protein